MWWILAALGIAARLLVLASVFLFRFALARRPLTEIPEGGEQEYLKRHPKGQAQVEWWAGVREARRWAHRQHTEEWEARSFDGLRLHALLISPAHPGNRAALCVHGYRSCGHGDFGQIQRFYLEQGLRVLLVDDRAHGKSEGNYLGFGWLDRLDCKTWCQELVRRLGPDCSIVLHGVSMGAATVLAAAGEPLPPQVKGVIGDCGYTSAWDQFGHILKRDFHLPVFPLLYTSSLVCRICAGYWFQEDAPVKQLEKSALPLLIIHGEADGYVPTAMSHQLLAASRDPGKKLVLVPGAAHAQSYAVAPDRYQQAVMEFFRRIGMA